MIKFMKLPTVLTLIASLALTGIADAGRIPGPGETTTRVEAYDSDRFTVPFQGRDWAEITVDGDGDTDLDLYVYDDEGNLVACDNDELDYCVVRFRPSRTGDYTIIVENLGSVWNQYTLETN